MSTYIYEAYNHNGVLKRGEYEGDTRKEVVDYLIKHELTPVSIKKFHTDTLSKTVLNFTLFERLDSVDILFFVRNLSTTIKAGLSIVEALDILINDAKKSVFKKILQEAQASVKNGRLLSDAFEAHSNEFPAMFIGMLKAGELSGQLDKTLAELARYLAREFELRGKIKGALTYPIILLVAATGVVSLLLIFVLPKLTKSFAQNNVELPLVTKIFLTLSNVLTYSFTLDFAVVAILIWFFTYYRTTKTGKKFFFWIFSHFPVAKDLVKKIALVRFSRTFGNLIGNGLSAVESLELSAQTIGNTYYTEAITESTIDIKNGVSMATAFSKYPELFPQMLISLMTVGERTGSLQSILITFADFYEEEVDANLKALTSLLEPLLLLVMGLMVGAIAFSIILPIYQLVGHFS